MDDHARRTLEILVVSAPFNAALEGLTAAQVSRAPPMAAGTWGWQTHREVRMWAQGLPMPVPAVVSDYIAEIRRRIPPD